MTRRPASSITHTAPSTGPRWPYLVSVGLLALLGLGAWQVIDTLQKQPPTSFSETRSVFALSGASKPPAATTPLAMESGPTWLSLSAAQRKALEPLENLWPTLTDVRKREWLAVVENFDRMRPAARERLQARMKAWSHLTAQQRRQARLNFSDTKNLPPNERRAQWEAYQSLSDEEKERLAAQARQRTLGAATSPNRADVSKLVQVPAARAPQALSPNPPKILPQNTKAPELFAPVLPPPSERPAEYPDVQARPILPPAPIATSLPPLDPHALQEGELAGPPADLPPDDLYLN